MPEEVLHVSRISVRFVGGLLLLPLMFSIAAAEQKPAGNAEQTALELRVQLTRLGNDGDPAAREAIWKKIIEQCPNTEEAEAAFWALSNLYLDDFEEPREPQAREVLEQFLKRYPDSRWTSQVKCRLHFLCVGVDDERAAQLRGELLKDKALPQVLRTALSAGR